MSDPPLSEIDFKHKMASVWTALKSEGNFDANILKNTFKN